MNIKTVVHNNWKSALVAGVALAVGLYAGPVGSKAVSYLLPKALEHVSTTPVEDVLAHKSPFVKDPVHEPSPQEQALGIIKDYIRAHPRNKQTLDGVRKDWDIKGRLDCRVVEK